MSAPRLYPLPNEVCLWRIGGTSDTLPMGNVKLSWRRLRFQSVLDVQVHNM